MCCSRSCRFSKSQCQFKKTALSGTLWRKEFRVSCPKQMIGLYKQCSQTIPKPPPATVQALTRLPSMLRKSYLFHHRNCCSKKQLIQQTTNLIKWINIYTKIYSVKMQDFKVWEREASKPPAVYNGTATGSLYCSS